MGMIVDNLVQIVEKVLSVRLVFLVLMHFCGENVLLRSVINTRNSLDGQFNLFFFNFARPFHVALVRNKVLLLRKGLPSIKFCG